MRQFPGMDKSIYNHVAGSSLVNRTDVIIYKWNLIHRKRSPFPMLQQGKAFRCDSSRLPCVRGAVAVR